MQPTDWSLAPPRKRPKRVAKKLASRLGWKHHPPRSLLRIHAALSGLEAMKSSEHFLPLGGDRVRPCTLAESMWFLNRPERHLARERVGPFDVSTVFLVTDANFGYGPSLLWETMIFHDEEAVSAEHIKTLGFEKPLLAEILDLWQWRFSKRSEAMAAHRKIVDGLRGSLN